MPEVTRFFGIVIRMYFNDHSPSHFHAEYGGDEALIEIETLAVLRGGLPRNLEGPSPWYSNGQPFTARN